MKPEVQYIIDVLRELVQISSVNPPGNEKVLAQRVVSLLEAIGIQAVVEPLDDHRANALGILEGQSGGPTLVLNGHLDTVPVKEGWDHPPFGGEVVGDRIYGLGTADMKGAIASMIGAVKCLKDSKARLKGRVLLALVADEERNNQGVISFLHTHRDIDYAVIGEPTSLRIANSNRGVMRFRITTLGRAAHASNPAQGSNAIDGMNKVMSGLQEVAAGYVAQYEPHKVRYSDLPSLAVTMIHGGTGENIIPDRCEIIVDRRVTHGEDPKDVEKEIRAVLHKIESAHRAFSYTIEKMTAVSAWKVAERSPFLQLGMRAYQKAFHTTPELGDLGATCEAKFFAEQGIDTFLFGPGHMRNAHTKDEYVEIGQLVEAAEYYCTLIKEALPG